MNNARPDLNLIVVFDAVAQAGSVTRASQKLALSQPAVSHALNRLRRLTGDPLFVRGRGRLTLTPFAESLKGESAEIIDRARAALAGPTFDPATTTRAFRIGVSDYAALTLAPLIASALRRAAPAATLDLGSISDRTPDALVSGECDATFWGTDPPAGPFESAEVFHDRFVALTGRSHPLAALAESGGAITLDDYLASPHVRVAIAGTAQSPIDLALRRLGHARRIAVTAPGFASLLALLEHSPLVATVPMRLAKLDAGRRFAAFPLPFDAPPFPYRLVWHRKQNSDVAHRWLRALIIGAARAS